MSRLLLVLSLLIALPLSATDLTVGWISRQPELPFVWGSPNPAVDGWPLAGSQVTWRGHIRSFFTEPKDVEAIWRYDGVELARSTVTLAPQSVTTIEVQRPWTFERHTLSLSIDTRNAVSEQSEGNNRVEVITDALSVGLWVEQTIYDHFRKWQASLGVGSTTFEDWAQRNVAFFNDMAALAVYPETPHGVHDRWRLQKIVVVPDGALPLNGLPDDASPGATGGTHPDKNDTTVDLMWGFRAVTKNYYNDVFTADPSNPFYQWGVLFHELGHARYLVDVYAWNVRNTPPHFIIGIEENGQPAFGAEYVHRTPELGMMNNQLTYIDRYSAIAMNFVAGQRARYGNYNEPRDFGSFLNDLPEQNRLTIRDANGTLMTNANVRIYQSLASSPSWYATNYDNTPDLELTTDANGQVLVGRSPFAADGKVRLWYGTTNGTVIVRVEKNGVVSWGFLESRVFNLEYWKGNTRFADHSLTVGRSLYNGLTPRPTSPAWDATSSGPVTLTWDGVPGATHYDIYASSNLATPKRIATTSVTKREVTVALSGRVYWWIEARMEDGTTVRSDVGRFRVTASKRRAVN
jgi:hypothetical protein